MPKVVGIFGYHNSGKTTLGAALLKELQSRGYKVAVIKSTKHRDLLKEKEGSDTYRYLEAGSEGVAIVEPAQTVVRFKIDKEELNLKELANRLFWEFDLVLCEGFKRAPIPKIEVLRKETGQKPLFPEVEGVVAVATDYPVEGIKNLPLNNPKKVADFLEEEFLKESYREGFEVELFVNGKFVELKPFIRQMLAELLQAFLKPLKGIDPKVKSVKATFLRRER
jgi:molybdopterin-guanine dinucleotide biosynthesis protein B